MLPLAGPSVTAHNSKTALLWSRRAVQLACLALWLLLFLLTRDSPESDLRADLFLITDPLLAALTMGAARIVVPVMAFSLLFVLVTLVVGRAFCGWICPLGTLIDGVAKLLRPPESRFSMARHLRMQQWKYYLLVLTVVGALLSAQWVYLLDPLVLLFRGMAAGIFPAVTALLPDAALSEELRLTYHGLAFAPVALLLFVLALTAITPRFYCRYLCPLGAFYGLLSRVPLLRRRVEGCDACTGIDADKQCIPGCRMGAVPSDPHATQNHECIRCFSGRSFCHIEAIRCEWIGPRLQKQDAALAMSRRLFLVYGAAGAGLAPLVALSAFHRGDENAIVRPPRVLDEETFADQCIRCAMCVQACPTQTLQLTHLESGVAGFWTPAVTPRVGGCIAECNDCSVVCPTDAIPEFGKAEADKWATKMGTAVLEKGRCISFTDNLPCAKCIDICPTKAFVVEPKTAANPRRPTAIDYVRCVGCGLCELECARIVFGVPALLTFAHGRGQATVLRQMPTEEYEPPIDHAPKVDSGVVEGG